MPGHIPKVTARVGGVCDLGHIPLFEPRCPMAQMESIAELRRSAPNPPCHSPTGLRVDHSPRHSQTGTVQYWEVSPVGLPGVSTSLHFYILKCAVRKYSGRLLGRRHVSFLRIEDIFHPFSFLSPLHHPLVSGLYFTLSGDSWKA